MAKRKKFDLTHLVHDGYVKDGEMLYFVSDPTKSCKVMKQPNHEYKVLCAGETITVHAFAQKCLGQEPPDHATKWIRNEKGKTLFDMWNDEYAQEAA